MAGIGSTIAKNTAKKMMQAGRKEEAVMHLASSADVEPEPTLQRLIVNDTSVEALGERMRENPNRLLLVRHELSGWIATLMQEDRQSDRAFFLETLNGNSSFSLAGVRQKQRPLVAGLVGQLHSDEVAALQQGGLGHHAADAGGVLVVAGDGADTA